MNATHTLPNKPNLTVTHVLAELLERLEHSKTPVDAAQYQSVVDHLVNELAEVQQGIELGALLDTHPAAAELYENLNYQHAGLCRSSLDASLAAEQQALTAIHSAMKSARQAPTHKGSTDEQS
jgi:hypothetical protein